MFGHFAFMPGIPPHDPARDVAYGGLAHAPPASPADRARMQGVIAQDTNFWTTQKSRHATSYKNSGLVRELAAFLWCATMETLCGQLGRMADSTHGQGPNEVARLSQACVHNFQRMMEGRPSYDQTQFLLLRHDLLQLMLNRQLENQLLGLRWSAQYPDFLRCMTELCYCDNAGRGMHLLREAYRWLGLQIPVRSPSLDGHVG